MNTLYLKYMKYKHDILFLYLKKLFILKICPVYFFFQVRLSISVANNFSKYFYNVDVNMRVL